MMARQYAESVIFSAADRFFRSKSSKRLILIVIGCLAGFFVDFMVKFKHFVKNQVKFHELDGIPHDVRLCAPAHLKQYPKSQWAGAWGVGGPPPVGRG
jgi:hypothetical protein